MAVRVVRRVAERGVDPRLELLGEDVLEPVGLGVHLVERHAEGVRQEQLEQPVVAKHLERDAAARLGQRHAAVGRAFDEPVGGELLRHARDRRLRQAELRRQRARAHAAASVGLAVLELEDRLEVVLSRS